MRNQIVYKGRRYRNEAVNRIIDYFLFVQCLKLNYTVQKLLFLSTVEKLTFLKRFKLHKKDI